MIFSLSCGDFIVSTFEFFDLLVQHIEIP